MDKAYAKMRGERTRAALERRKTATKKKKPAKPAETKTDTPTE